jgi:hypothetical protein
MTCDAVLDVVDAQGLVEISAARMAAAKAHADHCRRCHDAFEAATRAVDEFHGLTRPTLARDMSDDVMQRIRAAVDGQAPTIGASTAPRTSVMWDRAIPIGTAVGVALVWQAKFSDGLFDQLTVARLTSPELTSSPPAVTLIAAWLIVGLVSAAVAWRAPMRQSDSPPQ